MGATSRAGAGDRAHHLPLTITMAPEFHLLPSSISPKIDSILHSHIYPQVGHVFRAVAKFKALLLDLIRTNNRRTTAAATAGVVGYSHYGRSTTKSRKNKISGFLVKMHLARARDRLDPATRAPCCYSSYYDYDYDYSAAWNAVVPAAPAPEVVEVRDDTSSECGYLCWLEEDQEEEVVGEEGSPAPAVNEIDRLAEKFIARFHAKFLLEKQESYRRYQEMIAIAITTTAAAAYE